MPVRFAGGGSLIPGDFKFTDRAGRLDWCFFWHFLNNESAAHDTLPLDLPAKLLSA